MIAVDTKVLVRLLVNDDAAQSSAARRLFDDAAAHDRSIRVGDTVLVELAWTLSRAYGRSRPDIAKALHALLGDATVVLESRDAVRTATEAFERGPADFADCLLCAKAVAAGCEVVATFDRGMKHLPSTKLLR